MKASTRYFPKLPEPPITTTLLRGGDMVLDYLLLILLGKRLGVREKFLIEPSKKGRESRF